jgi:peptidoglycan/xylan/chitin deacetylase (PgdA/CDA1 family)
MVENKNIIIMYHYIRDNTKLKAFSTEEFRKQIEYLNNRYKIISIEDFIIKKPKGNTCILTFDDGLKDGLTNALPILEELNLKGSFFIPTYVLKNKKMLDVQKRHLLLAKLGVNEFVKEFNKTAENVFHIKDDGKKNDYDDSLTSNLKYVLDNIDKKKSKNILNSIFKKNFDEEHEFSKIYLTKKDIKKMKSKGMEIGSHTHEHLWLGKLYFKDMKKDLEKSTTIFKKNFGYNPKIICYPFGSFNTFTKRVAKQLGIIAGVTINKNYNTTKTDPLSLNRYDCIDLFPWKNKFNL